MKNPFENEQEAMTIGDLSVENGLGFVLLHGEMTVRKDKRSLQAVENLLALLNQVKSVLQNDELPEVAADTANDPKIDEVANPFA